MYQYSVISFYAVLMQVLNVTLIVVAIFTMLTMIKALQVYIRKNS